MSSFTAEEEIVRWLARDAQDADRDVRELALDRLGALSDPSEILVAALADPDPQIRGTAAANLGRVRRVDAVPALVRAAHDEASDEVIRHVVGALAGYHDRLVLELLLELISQRSREYLIRMEVAVQLWKYDPTVVIPKLVATVLGDDHELVRSSAADSLALLDEVTPFDPARHDVWLRLAGDRDSGVANVAARALRQEDAPRVADVLAAISRRLHHPATDERSFALHRLSLLAPESATSLARASLDDEYASVRTAACAFLGEIRDPTAIAPLLAVLQSDPDPRVQTAALLGLENYRTVEIRDALLDLLATRAPSGDALSVLCRQLWKYPSSRTVELLRNILGSSVRLAYRPVVESALAFLERFVSSDLPSSEM